jgi:hypothetical protein
LLITINMRVGGIVIVSHVCRNQWKLFFIVRWYGIEYTYCGCT